MLPDFPFLRLTIDPCRRVDDRGAIEDVGGGISARVVKRDVPMRARSPSWQDWPNIPAWAIA